MLDSSMLFDQNIICGSNADERYHFPRIYLSFQRYIRYVSLLFPLIHPCKVIHMHLSSSIKVGCNRSVNLKGMASWPLTDLSKE